MCTLVCFLFVYISSYVASSACRYMQISSVISALMARGRMHRLVSCLGTILCLVPGSLGTSLHHAIWKRGNEAKCDSTRTRLDSNSTRRLVIPSIGLFKNVQNFSWHMQLTLTCSNRSQLQWGYYTKALPSSFTRLQYCLGVCWDREIQTDNVDINPKKTLLIAYVGHETLKSAYSPKDWHQFGYLE